MAESNKTTGGEERKEDRKFGVRGCGRGTGKHKNTGIFQKENNSFQ